MYHHTLNTKNIIIFYELYVLYNYTFEELQYQSSINLYA